MSAVLVSDVESVAPGASFRLGVQLTHRDGWHTYYKEPGDSGMATKVAWDLPAGFTVGELEWPAPSKHVEAGLTTNVYDGAATLAAAVRAPDGLTGGSVRFGAKVQWLECKEVCLPGGATLELTLPVEAAARPRDGAAELFATVPAAKAAGAAKGVRLWTALLLAFLGGMLLNLMPCVLPVLSIKVLGFLQQAQGEPGAARRHAALYSAGVLASFWALAGLLLVLRAAGRGLGWGFQLQSPVFVAALVVLFLLIALNLFGLFEVGVSLTRLGGGSGGAFMSGVLAVVAATPCTAPFMGAALGWAVTRPAPEALSVFTSLGLGMAWPYAALTASPALLKKIPKPGPWMLTLKKVLGALMLATAAWLGTVLFNQLRPAPAAAGGWEAFSAARVAELRAAGRPVFVDFTADWCLTCKVNERTSLDRAEVRAAFQARGVALLKADWTNNDPAITEALAAHGRSSVPFYLLYPADPAAPPMALPTLLTPGIVLDALSHLKEDNR